MKAIRNRVSLSVLLGVGLLLAGCVSSKYQTTSAVDAHPIWLRHDLGGEPVKVRLDTVIVCQGPGAWKKVAYWDEFIVTLTNSGPTDLSLTSVSLIDYAGAALPAGDHPWQLEKLSLAQRDRYLKAGVNFALNTLGYAAFTYGAVGAGAMIGAAATNSWAGVMTGATVGLVAVPVTAVVIYANNQKHRHAIEREFDRRRLPLPLQLRAGSSTEGSFFFPMAVGPRALRLAWKSADAEGVIEVPLPMLSGMHRAETK